ncbi:MAG TPA: GDYXXLXY domain-containing protein, partial [Geothrix sp.]
MRNLILLVTAAVVLVMVNYSIWQREQLISSGRTVLLELAPVDPRSLMQGDYMALRFKVASEAFPLVKVEGMRDGRLVLALDDRNVGTFLRFAVGSTAA